MTHITKRHYFKFSASSLAAAADTIPIISNVPLLQVQRHAEISDRTRNPEM